MSQPARDALGAGVVLVVGLVALSALALATYRPDGPRWPHAVVNGGAWVLVAVTGVVLLVSTVRVLAARWRRPA